MKDPDGTIWRTPNPRCPLCHTKRIHAQAELKFYHPWCGHGFDRGRWTDPMLDPLPPLELHGECDPEENR